MAGMNVSLIVNNLGGTSCLELYIIANSAIRYLGNEKSLHLFLVLEHLYHRLPSNVYVYMNGRSL